MSVPDAVSKSHCQLHSFITACQRRLRMLHELTTIFLWNETHQEKSVVAASASSEFVEVYYALENKCSRNGTSCTVSSHTWYGVGRQYVVQYLLLPE